MLYNCRLDIWKPSISWIKANHPQSAYYEFVSENLSALYIPSFIYFI